MTYYFSKVFNEFSCMNPQLLHNTLQKQAFQNNEEYKQTLTSDSIIENHSEAGPDVAEFSEEELRSVAERKYIFYFN